MEQSPSWEANRFPASQEIPRIIWNTKVHYRTHKCPSPVPIMIQLHPTSWRSILIIPFHLRLRLPSGLFPLGVPTKTLYIPHLSPYVLHVSPTLFIWILSLEQYLVSSTDH
jgi:hypothetical protein